MKRRRLPTLSNEKGFTLIELLVTVSIIGILAAIAFADVGNYKRRAFDTRSKADLHLAAMGEEAYYSDHAIYIDCIGTAACESTLPGFKGSNGTYVSMFDVPKSGATQEYFTGLSYHPLGKRNTIGNCYQWNSIQGGLQ